MPVDQNSKNGNSPELGELQPFYFLCANCGGYLIKDTTYKPCTCPPPATGKKFDIGKPRMELLPPEALTQCALVLGMGAEKYGAFNWSEGIHTSRLMGAMLRHLNAYNSGESKDPESNLSHIAHVAVTAMFLLHFEKYRPDLDDRKKFGEEK